MSEDRKLEVIRTLLAIERNYLAVERTQLAQLRTGLTVAVIAPSAAAAFAYVFTFFPETSILDIFTYVLLTVITLFGVYLTYRAYVALKETRESQQKIKRLEIEVMESSEIAKFCLRDFLIKEKP